jgi:hypothetical protein
MRCTTKGIVTAHRPYRPPQGIVNHKGSEGSGGILRINKRRKHTAFDWRDIIDASGEATR